MSAETQAYDALSDAVAVTAIVGDRIHPDFVPDEKTLPAIALTRVGTEYINTIHTAAPVGAIVNLEVWCMAKTRKAAEQLADAVVPVLAAAKFGMVDRVPQMDGDAELFASVLTVVFQE